MHEAMIAEDLLSAILEEVKKQNAKPIGAKISCGMLYAISDETLQFAFEAIAKGTPCEGIKLEIEHKPIQGRCKDCNEIFNANPANPGCLRCGGKNFDLLPDAPLLLEEIEFYSEQ